MATELDTLEEDQRKFVSNVSHDFRSPLTSIKGYVEAMLDGTIPVEMQDKYLNIILFETERLNKLTKSLIDLNQFGHHGIHLDIADFDINTMTVSYTPLDVYKRQTVPCCGSGMDCLRQQEAAFYCPALPRKIHLYACLLYTSTFSNALSVG